VGTRAVTSDDLERAAAVVAAAFADDPLMAWLLPGQDQRVERTRRWWEPLVAAFLAVSKGVITESGDAVLLWRRSDERLADAPGQPALADVVRDLVGPERTAEVGEALAGFSTIRPTEKYVYVNVVATHPSTQSSGLGSELMASLLGTIGEQDLIYLASTNPRNHSFYLRNDFILGPSVTLPHTPVRATGFLLRAAAR
jgi:ribosomal protein S18 acetylase RimI-like enzyme